MARTPLTTQRTTPSRTQLTRMQVDVPQGAFGGGEGLVAIGRAIAQGGDAIGAELSRRNNKVRDYKTATEFARFSSDTSRGLTELQRSYNPESQDFDKQSESFYDQQAEEFLKGVPAEQRDEYRFRIEQQRQGVVGQALQYKYTTEDAYFRSDINDKYQESLARVQENPDAFDVESQTLAELVGKSDIPEAEKIELAKNLRRGLQGSRYTGLATTGRIDPSAISGGGGDLESYYGKLSGAESGGRVDAKSSTSSATGLFQFTDGTWADLVKRYPDVGITLDGRKDPEQQRIAIQLFTAENADILARQGIPSTHANLHAMHFLGKGDGPKVLGAPDNAPISSLVGADKIAANPFLKGMTVGDFRAWSEKKMGGDGALDPRFNSLSYADRTALYNNANTQLTRDATAAGQQQTQAQQAFYETLYTGVLAGNPAVNRAFIIQQNVDGNINAAQTSKLLTAEKAEQGGVQAQAALNLAASTGIPADHTDADVKKAANQRLSGQFGGDAGFQQRLRADDPTAVRAAFGNSITTGVIPPVYATGLTSLLNSSLPQSVVSAAEQITGLSRRIPTSANAAFTSATQAQAGIIAATASHFGAEKANEIAARMIDPNQRQNVELLRAEGNKVFSKTYDEEAFGKLAADIWSEFGTLSAVGHGLNPFTSQINPTPALRSQFTDEYREAWTTAYSLVADTGVADQWADEAVKKNWGVTEVNGTAVFMKYPVSKAASACPPVLRDSHINPTLGTDKAARIQLVATEQTANRVRQGQQPVYQAFNLDTYEMYTNEDGTPKTVDFVPDEQGKLLIYLAKTAEGKKLELQVLDSRLEEAEKVIMQVNTLGFSKEHADRPEELKQIRETYETLRAEREALVSEIDELEKGM